MPTEGKTSFLSKWTEAPQPLAKPANQLANVRIQQIFGAQVKVHIPFDIDGLIRSIDLQNLRCRRATSQLAKAYRAAA
jgi:hypothetical protein